MGINFAQAALGDELKCRHWMPMWRCASLPAPSPGRSSACAERASNACSRTVTAISGGRQRAGAGTVTGEQKLLQQLGAGFDREPLLQKGTLVETIKDIFGD